MILSSPSKTFLCGEYAVLIGGSALVLTHGPRFTLRVSHAPSINAPKWLHPESPAGRLYKNYEVLLKDFDFEFHDPHEGRGGFGASGAQFATLYAFIKDLKNQWSEVFPGVLLKEFKELDSSNSSGCDVLAQWSGGGIVRINPAFPQDVMSLSWPFQDLETFVLPTGVKVPTHDHLKDLRFDRLESLKTISEDVVDAFLSKEERNFLTHLRTFSEELEAKGLVTEHSLEMVRALQACPGFKLAKPCGALGADTILLMVERGAGAEAKDFLKTNSFQWLDQALDEDRSLGVRIESASW